MIPINKTPTKSLLDSFDFNVSLGLIPGLRHVTINGQNLDINTSIEESIINVGGKYVFPTGAELLDIVSTSLQDDIGGTGAITLRIEGLDAGFREIVEDVVMDGLTIVTTIKAFLRVNRMFVTTSGSSQFNVGNITATQETSTLLLRTIAPGFSIDGDAVYTVPVGKSFFCRRLRYSTTTAAGTNPIVTFIFFVYAGGTRFNANNVLLDTSNQSNLEDFSFSTDIITQTSDIELAASTTKNSTQCKVQLRCILADNSVIATLSGKN